MNNTLPTTLSEIRSVASAMFSDKAVASVVVNASWGVCTVFRNGDVVAGCVQS